MHKLTSDMIRVGAALQIAAFEWNDTDIQDFESNRRAVEAIETILKKAQLIAKQMKKEF